MRGARDIISADGFTIRELTPWRAARLQAALEQASTTQDLLKLAYFWRYAPYSEGESRSLLCLRMAETKARSSMDRGLIADHYSEYFIRFNRHKRQDARRCMLKAEACARTSDDWLAAAGCWYCLCDMDENVRAVRALDKAASLATTGADFAKIAQDCILLFTNRPAAAAMMAEAERRASTRADWEAIRDAYQYGYGEAPQPWEDEDPGLPFEVEGTRVCRTRPAGA